MLRHFKDPRFQPCFSVLPRPIQRLARKNFKLGRSYRALEIRRDGDLYWFWIGHHSEYDGMVG
jgi:hypothetical protein